MTPNFEQTFDLYYDIWDFFQKQLYPTEEELIQNFRRLNVVEGNAACTKYYSHQFLTWLFAGKADILRRIPFFKRTHYQLTCEMLANVYKCKIFRCMHHLNKKRLPKLSSKRVTRSQTEAAKVNFKVFRTAATQTEYTASHLRRVRFAEPLETCLPITADDDGEAVEDNETEIFFNTPPTEEYVEDPNEQDSQELF